MRFKSQPIEQAYRRLPAGKVAYDPTLEWFLACRWWGERWADWTDLDSDEQARRIAVYRVQHMIDAVLQWDAAREQERRMRQRR